MRVRRTVHLASVRRQILKTIFPSTPLTIDLTTITIDNNTITIDQTVI